MWQHGSMLTRAGKRQKDANELAYAIKKELERRRTAQPEQDTRNPAAVALSKLGASKGGRARAASLTPARRRAIARKAAQSRWGRRKRTKTSQPT
jgi:hypothetical protein